MLVMFDYQITRGYTWMKWMICWGYPHGFGKLMKAPFDGQQEIMVVSWDINEMKKNLPAYPKCPCLVDFVRDPFGIFW